jgi:cell division protein FtsB
MPKALLGHVHGDHRIPARLAAENARLRARVSELEALTLRLAQENDALAAAADRDVLTVESDLQPA